jgi:hypothetical protein
MIFQNLLDSLKQNWKTVLLVLLILVVVYMCYKQEDFSEKHHHHHVHHHHAHHHHAHHHPLANTEQEAKHTGVLTHSVRVRINPGKDATCLQVSQLAVYDENGTNVALNRPVMYKSIHGAIPQGNFNISTDGNLSSRPFPQIYHDNTCQGNNTGEFWMIELEKPTYVSKVVYYNRQDCCQDRAPYLIVELLDQNQNTVATKPIISSSMSEEVDFSQ